MKTAVLISGGVDSSVALRLLQEQGHDITAFYLKIWLEDELAFLGNCPWEEDLAYVRAVCAEANVPLEIISFQQEYHDEVVAYTLTEIKAGRTPNPDIFCNQRIKFGAFYKKIGNQFDHIATGHYAQVRVVDGIYSLHAAPDLIKDQTYFLSHLSQEQLSRALFPIGGYTKPQVRELAERFNLPNKARKDSQGICFLGKIKFSDFVKHHCGITPGLLVEYETDKIVGEHEGYWYYTVGQRQGIGLSGGPWYVVCKNTEKNIVYISRQYYSPDKIRNSCELAACHWIAGVVPQVERLEVKLRHGAQRYTCSLIQEAERVILKLDDRDQGIAPGQFAVFYRNDECLGGAMIVKVL
ncbi:MAG: tRNA 2-thiouridine(34) synthase MnmA [Candidatus Babeliaceae bacterium]|jgi:tRNA-specific 2-thiouridylase